MPLTSPNLTYPNLNFTGNLGDDAPCALSGGRASGGKGEVDFGVSVVWEKRSEYVKEGRRAAGGCTYVKYNTWEVCSADVK